MYFLIKKIETKIATKIATKIVIKDDYIWDDYHQEYKSEIVAHKKKYLLNFQKKISFSNNTLFYKSRKRLHPNHQTLYEVIKSLNPKSMIEIGCGGGFHVSNLKKILPHSKILGLDRSVDQVNYTKKNFPNLCRIFLIKNFSFPFSKTEISKYKSDVIYTQAVLMHIQDKKDYYSAIKNTLDVCKKYIVLVESWPRHNFVNDYLHIQKKYFPEMPLYFYIKKNSQVNKYLALIVSKKIIYNSKKHGFENLNISNYEEMINKHLLRKI